MQQLTQPRASAIQDSNSLPGDKWMAERKDKQRFTSTLRKAKLNCTDQETITDSSYVRTNFVFFQASPEHSTAINTKYSY